MSRKQRSGSGIREGRGTGCTAITAGFVAVVAELLDGFVVALTAGHGLFPLEFCGEKAENKFGSKVRLTPRFGLATAKGATDAVALLSNAYDLGRWLDGNFYRRPLSTERHLDSDRHCYCPSRPQRPTLGALALNPKSSLENPETKPNFVLSFLCDLPTLICPLNLSLFRESLQGVMNRRQWAGVFSHLEASQGQFLFDLGDCAGKGSLSEYIQNSPRHTSRWLLSKRQVFNTEGPKNILQGRTVGMVCLIAQPRQSLNGFL
jgi:hypothetical protein